MMQRAPKRKRDLYNILRYVPLFEKRAFRRGRYTGLHLGSEEERLRYIKPREARQAHRRNAAETKKEKATVMNKATEIEQITLILLTF